MTDPEPKFVNGDALLEALFDDDSRPTSRWLRQMQRQRKIPYLKIGHLVRYNIEDVRAALAEKYTVRSRQR